MNHRTLTRCLAIAAALALSHCANLNAPRQRPANAALPVASSGATNFTKVATKQATLATLNRADAAYRAGNWPEAERAYRGLTQALPQQPYPWFRLGNTYVKTNQLELAHTAYSRALAHDARHAKALHNLALTNLMLTVRALERGVATLDANEPSVQMSRDLLRELKRIVDSNANPGAPATRLPPAPNVDEAAPLVRTRGTSAAPNRQKASASSADPVARANTNRELVASEDGAAKARPRTLTRGLRAL
jgi:tetratricopeptide (TPR) repeat protein